MAAKFELFLDLETTGLKPEEGAVILSIGAVAPLRGKKNEGKIAEFEAVVLPTPEQWAAASPRALEVNGMTWEYLTANGRPLAAVVYDFMVWLQDNGISLQHYYLVGQNPEFDLSFVRYCMPELEFVGFPFDGFVDIRQLYSVLVSRKVMPYLPKEKGGRSGKNISLALGVEPEPDVHTALEGARVVRRNYLRMLELGVRS